MAANRFHKVVNLNLDPTLHSSVTWGSHLATQSLHFFCLNGNNAYFIGNFAD